MTVGPVFARRATLVALVCILVPAATCRRDNQPRNLQEAMARRDNDSALRFCEDYFSALARPDPHPEHTRIMVDLYRQAFVRWSLARRGEVTRSEQKRIDEFRRYAPAFEPGGQK